MWPKRREISELCVAILHPFGVITSLVQGCYLMETYASSQRFSTMFRLSISIFHGGDAQPRGINRMYISRPFHSLNVLFCLALFGHLTGPSGPWAFGRKGGRCFCFGPSIHGVAVTRPRDNRDMNLLFFSFFWMEETSESGLASYRFVLFLLPTFNKTASNTRTLLCFSKRLVTFASNFWPELY